MQTFESKKRNLLPTLLIWAIFFSIPIGMLLVVTKFSPLVFLLVIPGFWFFFVIFRWLSVSIPKTKISVDESGLIMERNNQTVSVSWRDINQMKFFSSGGEVTILAGKFAKYLGFYRLETNKGNIDLSPTLDNLETLLKLIIEKGNLRKYSPTLERSIRGGSLVTQMGWGNYPFWQKEENYVPNDKDLDTAVGGISKSGIQLFFILAIAVIVLFLVFQYLAGKGII